MPVSRLDQIASEWRLRARELAQWAMERMVNRTDVWGHYTGSTREGVKAVTAPFKDERGKIQLQTSSLEKHFKAKASRSLLGLHGASSARTSRWLAIDVDRHDPDDLSISPETNFSAVKVWYARLQSLLFDPLLIDSNGMGGFHLLVFFEEPMDSASVQAFGKRLTADYAMWLDAPPEIFPGGGAERGRFGKWLRLPGRHHSRPHYSRVYNDELFDDDPWLEGNDAIDRILATRPVSAAILERQGIARRRPTICLDFDGVIHSYASGWQGETTIADPPTHGAVRAIEQLRERYRVVVHSPRCRTLEGRQAIEHWLAKNGIVVDEICEHKPPALLYLDDRAVRFDGNWDDAIVAIHDFRR